MQPLETGKKNISYINALIKQSELEQLVQFESGKILLIVRTSIDSTLYCVKHGKLTLGFTESADIAFQWLHNGDLFTQKEAKEFAKTGWNN